MYKETLRNIDGVAIFQVISLVIFTLFFIAMFFWVISIRKSEAEKMADLPLNDGDAPEPLQATPEGNTSHG